MSEFIVLLNNNAGACTVGLGTITVVVSLGVAMYQSWQNKKIGEYQKENDIKIEKVQKEIKKLNEENLKLQETIDKRDELRHSDYVESLAVAFINDNVEDIGYLPLCLIAHMYDRSYNYRRAIYKKFCSCSIEVQNKILEIRRIKIKRIVTEDFYSLCLDALIQCISDNKLSDNKCSIYYDQGKYLERTLLYGGNIKKIDFFKERQFLTDVLAQFFRDGDIKYPMDIICEKLDFVNTSNEKVYMIASEIAKYISIYAKEKNTCFNPLNLSENRVDIYLEDVFLDALLNIYYHLVME